jgi:hypothetical protein
MASDFILLAEQRQAEAQLKEKYEKLAVELKVCGGGGVGRRGGGVTLVPLAISCHRLFACDL